MKSCKKQLFIVGVQRSGTTLLRLILNAHSQIAIPRESVFLMPFLKKKYLNCFLSGNSLKVFADYLLVNADFKTNYEYYEDFFSQLFQRKKISLRDLIDEMFSFYCHRERKSIWGNKTPSFFRKIDILYALFPNALFVHIVRDGRDVFDSWRKIDPSKNNVAVAALDWRYKLFRIEKSFKKIPANNRATIRYEDLLENPEKTIKSICSLIGVEYEDNMLGFYQTSHNHTVPHHSKLICKPLNKENRYKWKKNLTSREVKISNLLSRYYLKKFNYEIENNVLNFLDVLFMFKMLFVGLPHKLIQIMRVKRVFEKAVRKSQISGLKKSK